MKLPDEEIITKINILLSQNLSNEKMSNTMICEELGLSRSNLHRIIRRNTQFSTTLYIRHFRLLKSKEFLANSPLRISEIAYTVGFQSHQNFSKYFKNVYGLSPSKFREKSRLAQ